MLSQGPVTLDQPIQFDASLPDVVDVVVVGGGVIGVATALSLAEQNKQVLVCEKGRVAGEQSSRNWGWVRQTGRDAAELPLMIESLSMWRDAASRTGENALSFSAQGVMYVSRSEAETAKQSAFVELAKLHGVNSVLLSAQEVLKKTPNASSAWAQNVKGGLWTESDGRVEPWGAVPALARAATRAGVNIKESCAVLKIETSGNGPIEVITEHGVVKAERVLLAAGLWTTHLARQMGISLPQLSVKGTVARLDNTPELFSGNTADSSLALAQRLDGGYTMALSDYQVHYLTVDSFRFAWPFRHGALKKWYKTAFRPGSFPGLKQGSAGAGHSGSTDSIYQRCRIVDPIADEAVIERMLSALKLQFDGCENAKASHAWAGMIETTPDFVPVLDEVSAQPGVFLATGFSGHGFGIGLAAGKAMSELICGRSSEHDLTRFRFSRFSDGSRLELGPI